MRLNGVKHRPEASVGCPAKGSPLSDPEMKPLAAKFSVNLLLLDAFLDSFPSSIVFHWDRAAYARNFGRGLKTYLYWQRRCPHKLHPRKAALKKRKEERKMMRPCS